MPDLVLRSWTAVVRLLVPYPAKLEFLHPDTILKAQAQGGTQTATPDTLVRSATSMDRQIELSA